MDGSEPLLPPGRAGGDDGADVFPFLLPVRVAPAPADAYFESRDGSTGRFDGGANVTHVVRHHGTLVSSSRCATVDARAIPAHRAAADGGDEPVAADPD